MVFDKKLIGIYAKSPNSYPSKHTTDLIRETFTAALKDIKTIFTSDTSSTPSCFVSYAWGHPDHHDWITERQHELWVDRLVATLKHAGLNVHYDKHDNLHSGRITPFTEQIRTCDYIVLVCTPLLKNKAQDTDYHVVQQELDMIQSRFKQDSGQVFPILLAGNSQMSVPDFFPSTDSVYTDFTSLLDQDIDPTGRSRETYYDQVFGLLSKFYQARKTSLTETSFQRVKELFREKISRIQIEKEREKEQIDQLIKEASRKRSSNTVHFLLPKRNPNFVGRDDELADIYTTLIQSNEPVVVQATSGLGGIGKTHLVTEYAWKHEQEYTKTIWLNAETLTSLWNSLAEFAQEAGIELKGAQESQQHAINRWLEANPGWLMVFDNAQDQRLIYPYIPSKGGHVLITSRSPHWEQITEWVKGLDVLKPEAAYELLSKVTKLSKEDDSLRELAKELGYLPLALVMAGSYIKRKNIGITRYLTYYQKQKESLSKNDFLPLDYPKSVYVTWSISMDEIQEKCPEAIILLERMSFLAPNTIPTMLLTVWEDISKAKKVSDTPENLLERLDLSGETSELLSTEEVIGELLNYSMVNYDADKGECGIHRLVQRIVRDGVSETNKREYLENGVTALSLLFKNVVQNNWRMATLLSPHGIEVIRYAVEAQIDIKKATDLEVDIANHQQKIGNLRLAEGLYEGIISRYKRIYQTDHHGDLALVYGNLAGVYQTRGQLNEAEKKYFQALEINTELGLKAGMANQYCNLGSVYETRGQLDQAVDMYNKSLDIEMELGRKAEIAINYGNLGVIYQTRGQLDQAVTMYEWALEINTALDRKEGLASNYGNLGNIYQVRRQLDQAVENYRQALAINTELGRKAGMAINYSNLGRLYQTCGQLDEAKVMYNKSLAIEIELGRKEGMAIDYGNLGNVYEALGQSDQAVEMYEQALAINKELGRKAVMANQYGNLGNMYKTCGRLDEAERMYLKTLQLQKEVYETDDHVDIAKTSFNLGIFYLQKEDIQKGKPMIENAYETFCRFLPPTHDYCQKSGNILSQLNKFSDI